MRFNFISETGDGMGMAYRVLQEGNDVRLWIADPEALAIGDGMVPRVGDIEDLIHDAEKFNDIFVFDTSGNGVICDGLRHQGFSVVGGGVTHDRLEKDRKYARKVMESVGICVPETFSFRSFDDGIQFASTAKDRMVYKPSKRLGEMSPSLVTYDQEDLLELLGNLKAKINMGNPEFDLQKFTKGLEISTEGWFDGIRFTPMFNHTFERKQLMNGNLGPSGGCTGNVVWACDGECPVCKEGIRKMEPFLRKEEYEGMIDLNAIIAEDGLYGLEFTPRFGYDASPTLFFGLLEMELGQFFADMAQGSFREANPLLQDNYAGAVKITIPPWPTEKHTAQEDVPIRGYEKETLEDVYWYNVKRDGSNYSSAGAWGIICLTIGRGKTIKSALKNPYELAEGLRIQDKQYRTDLVDQFEKSMGELDGVIL